MSKSDPNFCRAYRERIDRHSDKNDVPRIPNAPRQAFRRTSRAEDPAGITEKKGLRLCSRTETATDTDTRISDGSPRSYPAN
jgi:hypothetical protein